LSSVPFLPLRPPEFECTYTRFREIPIAQRRPGNINKPGSFKPPRTVPSRTGAEAGVHAGSGLGVIPTRRRGFGAL
jgi:hypothetical protein